MRYITMHFHRYYINELISEKFYKKFNQRKVDEILSKFFWVLYTK